MALWATIINTHTIQAQESIQDPSSISEVCDDGKDNDNNLYIDCADYGCFGHPSCAEICDDNKDNNNSGAIDCADFQCVQDEACTEICTDKIDNNENGDTDCFDLSCALSEPACELQEFAHPIELCDDMLDNDHDGYTDCNDATCQRHESCTTDDQESVSHTPPLDTYTGGVASPWTHDLMLDQTDTTFDDTEILAIIESLLREAEEIKTQNAEKITDTKQTGETTEGGEDEETTEIPTQNTHNSAPITLELETDIATTEQELSGEELLMEIIAVLEETQEENTTDTQINTNDSQEAVPTIITPEPTLEPKQIPVHNAPDKNTWRSLMPSQNTINEMISQENEHSNTLKRIEAVESKLPRLHSAADVLFDEPLSLPRTWGDA